MRKWWKSSEILKEVCARFAMTKEIIIVVTIMLIAMTVKEIICREFELGPCYLQFSDNCSNNSIQFFLFSSDSPDNAPMPLDKVSPMLNLNDSVKMNFKLIIHGYGGNLDFNGSKQVRNGMTIHSTFIYFLLATN